MWSRIVSLAIGTLILLAQHTLAGYTPIAQAQQSIIVVCDDNYPPYIFRDEIGDIKGILVDEWHAWEQKTGVTVTLKAMGWEKAKETMLRGEADVIDTIFYTDERAKLYDFTKPYARLEVPVFLHKDLGGISDPQSLRGFTIGVKKGDACIDVLKSFGIDTLKEYVSYHEVILAAKKHDIRLFSIDKPPALYYLYKYGMEDEYRSSFVLYTGEFHRAVKKGRAGLLRTVEDGFAAIPSQERKAIEEKWLGAPLVRHEYLRVLLIVGLSVAGLVLALLGFNNILRRKVRTKTAELDVTLRELGESEANFRTIFDSVSDCIFIHDPKDGRILDVNARTCAIFGYSREEFRSLDVESISSGVPPYTQDEAQRRIQQAASGQMLPFEWQCKDRDGHLFWVEVSTSRAKLGANEHVLVSLQDITHRRQAEAALRDSEAKYRSVIENITDVFYRTNAQGLLDMVSPSGATLLGYASEQEVLGLPIESFWMRPEQRAKLLARIMEDGKVHDYEVVLRRKDGSPVPVSTSSRLIRDESGALVGVEGIFRDITTRKQNEEALRELEKSYREMVEYAPIGIFKTTPQGRYLAANTCLARMLGYDSVQELIESAQDIGKQLYVDQGERQDLLQSLEQGVVQRMEVQRRRKDGSNMWASMSMRAVRDQAGKLLHVEGFTRDITDRKRNELALAEERLFTNAVLDSVPGLLYLYDDTGKLVRWNKQHEVITGYSDEELSEMHLLDWYKGDQLTQEKITRAIEHVMSDGHGTEEAELQTKSGKKIPFYFTAVSLEIEGRTYFTGVGIDITERKQLEEQLLYRALHDPLTGLANRTLCLDRIAQANERAARRPENTFAVVFIDLDGFKAINDSLGHEAGDLVLREVAKRLLACARRVDTVCRYGGDEFILVLEEVNPRETVRTVKRVQESLKHPLTVGPQKLLVQASYGIAYAPRENCQSEDLLRNANIALHRAKLSGRDRMVAYRKGMHEAAIHTLSLQGDMRRGLDADEFFMVYQPIFNLADNRLAGFEALIRWRHPQRGLVGPGEFIPMAEESGFIYELGHFALNQACTDMVDLLSDLPLEDHLTISVNLSPRQLSRQGLADQIEQTLTSTGLPPSSLVLEITESSIMKYPEASAHILARLKGKGVGIAIDDFGTGYSSMSVLQKLPLDRLKIDMSFVARMTDSREDREIVRAIITLSHSLSLKTVAEGIETEEQRLSLRHMGCDLGQGYLCSRPILLADVPEAVRQMVCIPVV